MPCPKIISKVFNYWLCYPPCPKYNGYECNKQGICIYGKCNCYYGSIGKKCEIINSTTKFQVLGWGITDSFPTGNLQIALIDWFPTLYGQYLYKEYNNEIVDDNYIFLLDGEKESGGEQKDTAHGDSGGPLIICNNNFKNSNKCIENELRLAGVVSFGCLYPMCKQITKKNYPPNFPYPGAYTNILYFIDYKFPKNPSKNTINFWIMESLKRNKETTCPFSNNSFKEKCKNCVEITNGNPANEDMYQSVVMITDNIGDAFCGGTIIDHSIFSDKNKDAVFVLTAAHCLYLSDALPKKSGDKPTQPLGIRMEYNKNIQKNSLIIPICEVWYGDWQPEGIKAPRNDIALLRLSDVFIQKHKQAILLNRSTKNVRLSQIPRMKIAFPSDLEHIKFKKNLGFNDSYSDCIPNKDT